MAKRPPKRPSARQVRRQTERAQTALESERERLFLLEPGGNTAHPLEVASAAVIDGHATALPCPRCGGSHELVEHAAVVRAGVRLREAKLRCRQCGSKRSSWFKLGPTTLN